VRVPDPSGSVKDRFAAHVITDAEHRGWLRSDSIILECTSGNTGIALAMVGAAKGYRVTILMSEGASAERRYLMRQLGAELKLFRAGAGYQTGIRLSEENGGEGPPVLPARQFENPLNASDHEHGTGPEILRQVRTDRRAGRGLWNPAARLPASGKAIKARYPGGERCSPMEPAEAAMLCGRDALLPLPSKALRRLPASAVAVAPLDGEVAVAERGSDGG